MPRERKSRYSFTETTPREDTRLSELTRDFIRDFQDNRVVGLLSPYRASRRVRNYCIVIILFSRASPFTRNPKLDISVALVQLQLETSHILCTFCAFVENFNRVHTCILKSQENITHAREFNFLFNLQRRYLW